MKTANQYRAARKNEARARGLVWRVLDRRRIDRTHNQIMVVLPPDDGHRIVRAKHLKATRTACGMTRKQKDRHMSGNYVFWTDSGDFTDWSQPAKSGSTRL